MIDLYASSCTVAGLSGTGSGPCDVADLGDLIGADIHQIGLKWNVADDVFLTKWTQYLKQKKLFPLNSLYNFEQATPENERSTSSVGVMRTIREGKPQYTLMYSKSHCFHKRVFEKAGNGKWAVILKFEKGILVLDSYDGLTVSGFPTSMFEVGTFRFKQGTDPQMTSVTFQLPDAFAFNTRMRFISNEAIAAALNEIEGSIEVDIVLSGEVEAGATEYVVDVKSACSGTAVTGLAEGDDVNFANGGTTEAAVTGVAESTTVPGRYTITTGALLLNDTIQPKLNDGTYDVVEDIDGVYYSGTAKTVETVGVTPSV